MKARDVREAMVESVDVVRRTYPLLALGFLVDAAFLFVFLIVLQSYLPDSLHASTAVAGYALATFGAAKLLTQLASGFVSDRLGTRRAMLIGTALLLAADVSIWPLAHIAPWLIVVSGAVEGLGSSVTWPAVYSAGAARVGASHKGRFTALLTLSTGAALIVGLGGGGVLEYFVSFDVAMVAPVVAISVAFALALLMMLAVRETPLTAAHEIPTPGRFRAIISSRDRASFALLVLAESAALGALTAAFRAYGRDVLDVSLTRQAVLLAPAALLGGALVVPGGAIADRVGARRVMTAGFATTGVCLLVLSHWGDAALVAVVAAVAGGAFGLAAPSVAATMMSLAGPEGSRGGVIGWFMTMDGVGHAAGPAAAGLMLGVSGASAVLLTAGTLFLFVAYIALTSRLGEGAAEITPARAGAPTSLIGGQS